jgi:UDP:flavonoid glycosyltransferase YjiC (YdhE family)
VRLLFTFTGGPGHLDPLLPIATAARAAGHAAAVAGRAGVSDRAAALELEVFETEPVRTRRRRPLLPVDVERERSDFRQGFAARIAREKAAALLPVCAAWRPDALVCEETDFGGPVVAERLGLPHATVLVIAARSFATPDLVAETLDELRAEHGLPPDPELAAIARHLVLVPFPPSYRDPVSPLPITAHAFRPARAPDPRPDEPPLVYFSLGTEFNIECGDLFARVLAGLRDLPVSVLATVGAELDPAELGPQPARVRVERYVPQAAVLPHASVVVSHGGSGSVLGALAHGLPLVLLPMGADQPYNAARCEALGVARSLDVIAATPADVRDAVAEVLGDPSYRMAAERLRDEFAALPGPEHAVALIEQLV